VTAQIELICGRVPIAVSFLLATPPSWPMALCSAFDEMMEPVGAHDDRRVETIGQR
jgi:hypothetical protein